MKLGKSTFYNLDAHRMRFIMAYMNNINVGQVFRDEIYRKLIMQLDNSDMDTWRQLNCELPLG